MRRLIAEIEAGRAEASRYERTLTVDQLLERWQAANVNDWNPTTARDHQRTAGGWVSPHLVTVWIKRLPVEQLKRFYSYLRQPIHLGRLAFSAANADRASGGRRSLTVRWCESTP